MNIITMKLLNRLIYIFIFQLISIYGFCQNAVVYGKITDQNGKKLELVNVSIVGMSGGTASDMNGNYELKIPSSKQVVIAFSILSYAIKYDTLNLSAGQRFELNVILKSQATNLTAVNVEANYNVAGGIVSMNPKTSVLLPTYGGFETMVKLVGMGVSSGNELSSTYSVRGGNFDENIVYVNDIEIYRPFLIRSGQQEGLSFLNSSLVNSVSFSSGGFEAKYGDKISSVLDVKYKRPDSLRGDVQLSLLGANAHLEGVANRGLMTFLSGFRYKNSKYILSAMDTKGAYKPMFIDWQNYLTWQLSETSELSFLGYFSSNRYSLIPKESETSFGTFNQALQLKIYFEGGEIDKYLTFLGGLRFQHQPNKNLLLKYIASGYSSFEDEKYDIKGEYWLGLLDTDMGSDRYGEIAENLGVGAYMEHARNFLDIRVFSLEHKGLFEKKSYYLHWSVKAQTENISDKLWQWNYIDSSGYSLPHLPDSVGYTQPQDYRLFDLDNVLISKLSLNSLRYSSFLQYGKEIVVDSARLNFIAGVRASYWSVNKQTIFSPRFAMSFKPNWNKDFSFRLATGVYQQPPFYRELRDFSGKLHKNVKAQQSIHFVLGAEHVNTLWNRPCKVAGEVYYKALNNMIPYVIDNVRIKYLPQYTSRGYATGLDLKLNGQFVSDAESWVSISIMKTQEDINGDYYYLYFNANGDTIRPTTIDKVAVDSLKVEPGFIPRPTDQRFNISLFFQDYLPKNPSYKMHLSLVFGTGLPFGFPNEKIITNSFRMPAYRRVDIGFSKQLIGHKNEPKGRKNLKFIKNAWVSLEVFNLLNINNTASYIWVRDVENNSYAVPNYLTSRQLNLRLLADF